MKRYAITALLILTALASITAQQLTYNSYMQRVMENNASLVAQSMEIEISKAAVKSAKVYNDPTLSVEYGNNEDWNTNLGQSFAATLGRTFTFGVRSSNIRLAQEEFKATKAVFNDYVRNLYADASIAYLQHLRAKALLATAIEREHYMQQLSQSDSLRYTRGDIAKTAWIETRLAAGLAHNGRLSAEAEYRNSIIELGYFMGTLDITALDTAVETLQELPTGILALDDCIEQALANRADIDIATSNIDIARAQKKLNSARRRIDLELNIGAEYNDADPSFTKVKVGAAIPLRFSNLNRGARIMEQARIEQAQQELVETRLRVQTEVMQAHTNCRIAERQADTFTQSMLQETSELLSGKRQAYSLGEISFLEFIETERSDNLMTEEYINALYNRAASIVELMRSIGITSDTAEQ